MKKIVNGTSVNIANLINMIITNGHNSKSLALGRTKPVFKGKGSTLNVMSYRPILVKNALAKIVDGILFGNQLNASIERNLTPNMFAYRSSLGTEDAVIRIRETIIAKIEKRKQSSCRGLGYKKGF